jgi:AcrR family transcriptional regulator
LIDHKGLSSFSMRDLSRSLGVYPASIYWHVGGSKAQLFGEISSRITATVMTPAEACADWRDTLRTFFQRYRAAVAKHPNVAPLLGAQLQSNGLPNAPMVEIVLQALQQAGYQGQGLVDAFNAVIGGLAGFVTMEFGPAPPEDHEGWAATLRDQMDGLDPATFPAISGLLPLLRNRAFVLRWQNGSDVPLDGGFSCLVESLIRGLERSAP